MKHLKNAIYIIFALTVILSCEKEQNTLFENTEVKNQEISHCDRPENSVLTFYYEEEGGKFYFPCEGLPLEDFNEPNFIDIFRFNGILDENGNGIFRPGDIVSGVEFSSSNNAFALINYDPYHPSNILVADGETNLIINFTEGNVQLASMKIAQWSRTYRDVYLDVYGWEENLLGESSIFVHTYGKYWGVSSKEPIMKIIIRSSNGLWPGVDDISFGYCDDLDNDGILNEDDPYPNSNRSETLSFGENNLDIKNMFIADGTTMMDQIDNLIIQINESYRGESNWDELHKAFTTKLAHITYYWRINKLITAGERAEISNAGWNTDIPYFNQKG